MHKQGIRLKSNITFVQMGVGPNDINSTPRKDFGCETNNHKDISQEMQYKIAPHIRYPLILTSPSGEEYIKNWSDRSNIT